jgi:hypothetical protein
MKENTEDKALAKKYRVSRKTISRWREQGAPLGDPVAMRAWQAARKNVPKSSIQSGVKAAVAPGQLDITLPDDQIGVARMFGHLEQGEGQAWRALQLAIKGGDPLAIKLAHTLHLKAANALRDASLKISEQRRSLQRQVARDEVEAWLKDYSRGLSLCAANTARNLAAQITGMADSGEVASLLRNVFDNTLVSGAAMAAVNKLPDWFCLALQSDLESQLTNAPATIAARAELLATVNELTVADMVREARRDWEGTGEPTVGELKVKVAELTAEVARLSHYRDGVCADNQRLRVLLKEHWPEFTASEINIANAALTSNTAIRF